MGGQLVAQAGGLPCPTPSCKPAGGTREVKTRLEEPGGGWRLSTILLFSQKQSESFHLNLSNFRTLVCCGLAGRSHVPVFSRVEGEEINK